MKDNNHPSSSSASFTYKPVVRNINIEQLPVQHRRGEGGPNKTFFSNIKAELNNIRSDMNKLVSNSKDMGKVPFNKSCSISSSAQKMGLSLQDPMLERTTVEKKISLFESGGKPVSNHGHQQKVAQFTSKASWQQNRYEDLRRQCEQHRKTSTNLKIQLQSVKDRQKRLQQEVFHRTSQLEKQKHTLQRSEQQKQKLYQELHDIKNKLMQEQYKNKQVQDHGVAEENRKLNLEVRTLRALVDQLRGQVIEVTGEFDHLRGQLDHANRQLDHTNTQLDHANRQLDHANNQLDHVNGQLAGFEASKQLEIAAITNNFQERMSRAQAKSFKELGTGFEVKINELLDDNYYLKNKITSMQSQIQQSNVHLESLRATVSAYQQRDREIGKGALQEQMQNLQNKIMQLQEQKDKMQSEHEYEIMKLQNTIDELKSNKKKENEQNINQILKDQINQIENLKQRLRDKNRN